MRPQSATQWFFLLACVGFPLSCQPPNHHLIHPKDVPPQVQTWVEEVERGPLLIHLEWARPAARVRFPLCWCIPMVGARR